MVEHRPKEERTTPGEHGHFTTTDRDACPVCNPSSKQQLFPNANRRVNFGCFWQSGCSDSARCNAHGSCVAASQAGGATFPQQMEPDTRPLTHQEIFSAVAHHASEIARLTAAVPVECKPSETQPVASNPNHERWLAETWKMIETCAADIRSSNVTLSPEGCRALLGERNAHETAPSLALELRSNLHGGPAPALHDGVTGKAKCVICGNFNRFWYVISGCNFCQSCVSEALSSPLEPRRDDPNAPFRWICPKCTTVNGIADEVCLGGSCGTKRPEKAREHHPRCELMQPHGHEPPKCTCSGLNGSPVTTENDNG